MNAIHLIGLDGAGVTPEKARALSSSIAVFCADRFIGVLQPWIADTAFTRLQPISPLSQALTWMEHSLKQADIAVVVGGDPLFFGIGRTVVQRFGEERVRVYPAVSSMQAACARFKIPWEDAHFLSVHGRDLTGVAARIVAFAKVVFLTDAVNSPSVIAATLLTAIGERHAADYTVHVAENLDEESERLTTGGLAEIAGRLFSGLSVMILLRCGDEKAGALPRFGLKEDEIHHSRGLITKDEIRAATLHALRLPDAGVFWDVGAGSGSIGIEAARMLPMLQVYAVEAKKDRISHILANRQNFSAYNLTAVHGDAPAALQDLPDPERIFIGGGGNGLPAILDESVARLKQGGIIVVNAVLEKTRLEAPEIMYRKGLSVSMATLQVRRSAYPAENVVSLNPITIVSGCKR